MNEFTKQELENIHYDLVRNNNPWQCGETIINKIQSMIDNYCDHETEWINVHEKLPECGQYVIAYCWSFPTNFVSMVRYEYSKNGHYFWNDSIDREGNVTHWMHLPNPPL